ncbi:MAG: hypothetical protein WBG50_07205 [Desulfomonilaceae bacterium]
MKIRTTMLSDLIPLLLTAIVVASMIFAVSRAMYALSSPTRDDLSDTKVTCPSGAVAQSEPTHEIDEAARDGELDMYLLPGLP